MSDGLDMHFVVRFGDEADVNPRSGHLLPSGLDPGLLATLFNMGDGLFHLRRSTSTLLEP